MSDRDKDAEILALRHQITVLERQLGNARPRLLPSDRAFLAALLHRLPRDVLGRFRLLVRPDTVLRWHRDLLARRHAARSRPKRPGRPRTARSIRQLVLRLARENPASGSPFSRSSHEMPGTGPRSIPASWGPRDANSAKVESPDPAYVELGIMWTRAMALLVMVFVSRGSARVGRIAGCTELEHNFGGSGSSSHRMMSLLACQRLFTFRAGSGSRHVRSA